MHFVNLALRQLVVGFVCQRPSPDTVNRPVIQFLSAFVKRLEEDAVRMKRQEHLRFPSDIGLGHRAQHFENCRIRHVAFACSRQAPIERNIKRTAPRLRSRNIRAARIGPIVWLLDGP